MQAPVAACIRRANDTQGMTQVKKILLAVAAAVTLCAAAAPAQAHASCGGWGAYNLDGEYAAISKVHPRGGMNCASSRYVVNKWLKRAYQRQYSNRIPTHFWDGYVTWYGYKTGRHSWRFEEYDSGTSFTFTGVYYG